MSGGTNPNFIDLTTSSPENSPKAAGGSGPLPPHVAGSAGPRVRLPRSLSGGAAQTSQAAGGPLSPSGASAAGPRLRWSSSDDDDQGAGAAGGPPPPPAAGAALQTSQAAGAAAPTSQAAGGPPPPPAAGAALQTSQAAGKRLRMPTSPSGAASPTSQASGVPVSPSSAGAASSKDTIAGKWPKRDRKSTVFYTVEYDPINAQGSASKGNAAAAGAPGPSVGAAGASALPQSQVSHPIYRPYSKSQHPPSGAVASAQGNVSATMLVPSPAAAGAGGSSRTVVPRPAPAGAGGSSRTVVPRPAPASAGGPFCSVHSGAAGAAGGMGGGAYARGAGGKGGNFAAGAAGAEGGMSGDFAAGAAGAAGGNPQNPQDQLPYNWSPMPDRAAVLLDDLPVGQVEYRAVKRAFELTCKGYTVGRIQRVQNPYLLSNYEAKRTAMEKRGIYPRETKLFHGTAGPNVEAIAHTGFNRSYAGKHAVVYGKGAYFAKNASYSAQSIYTPPDSNGDRYMFYVNVLVGDYCQGVSDCPAPPEPRPGGHGQYDLCDSTVNVQADPTIYVTFHDSQAYPAYLITFRSPDGSGGV